MDRKNGMKKIILLLSFLSIFIINPKSILAQEYVVQPRIIIPSDYESRTPASLVDQEFKPNVILALKEVQAWYAKQLKGKTFKIKEDVSILRLKKPAGYTEGMKPMDLYNELGRTGLLIDNESVLNALWLVGTNTKIDQGGWDYLDNNPNRQIRIAWMNYDNLEKINPKRDAKERNIQLGILAHELGHAFGLLNDGRAKWHTCSVEKTDECNGGPPYPAKKFWYSSVMGYGGVFLFPDVGLNNTPDNPDVQKALLSPFLNPTKEAGPTPADDSTTFIPPAVQILSISPKVVTSELGADKQGRIEIRGQGFGGKEGKVNFYKAEDNTWYKLGEVVSWQPDYIKVKTFIQYNIDQKVKIEVTNDFGQKSLSTQEVLLSGDNRLLIPKPSSVVPSQQTYPGVITNLEIFKRVQAGDSFILKGQGFGSKMGNLEFYSSFLSKFLNDNRFEIQSWSDNQISVKFFNNAGSAYEVSYIVIVKNPQGVVLAKSKDTLGIQTPSKQRQNYTITVDVKTTCGNDKIPFSDAEITLSKIIKDQVTKLVSALPDSTGKSSVSYTVEQPKTGDVYEVLVKSGDKVMPLVSSTTTNNLFTISDSGKDLLHQMEFNLPQCPVSRSQGGIEPNVPEDNIVQRVIISNTDDFTPRQDVSGAEINRVEVVENPEEQKEIIWEQPLTGGEETFIRVIENDGDISDYQADLSDGDYTEVGGVQIKAKVSKRVARIDLINVGDESNRTVLYDIETGYQNPEIDLPNNLNLFKIVTIFDDASEEEDSSFYIEKAQESSQEPVAIPELAPEAPVVLSSCVWDDNLGRMVVLPNEGNPFDCQDQDQICQEFTNNEGQQDAKCVNPQEGEQ